MDETFDPNNALTFKDPHGFPDLTGRIGEYFQGNEPANQVAYIYDTAKKPSKPQAMVRDLMDDMYSLKLTARDKGILSPASLQAAENDPELVQNSGIPGTVSFKIVMISRARWPWETMERYLLREPVQEPAGV